MRTLTAFSFYLIVFASFSDGIFAQSTLPPEMVLVQGGSFTMGCTSEQFPNCDADESPTNEITLPDFYIGKYETTQGQWQSLMNLTQAQMRDFVNTNFPLSGVGANYPIYYVSWFQAAVFCNKLSEQEGFEPCYFSDASFTQIFGKTGNTYSLTNAGDVFWKEDANGYRFPTEAEWEFAARGGIQNTGLRYAGTGNVNLLNDYANFWNGGDGFDNTASPVGSFLPNKLGLYDMSGNMWEWCYDWYDPVFYSNSPVCEPTGSTTGTEKVLRGGSWGNTEEGLRVANRGNLFQPNKAATQFSFRLARNF